MGQGPSRCYEAVPQQVWGDQLLNAPLTHLEEGGEGLVLQPRHLCDLRDS